MDIDARLKEDGMAVSDLDDYTMGLIDRTLKIQNKINQEEDEAERKEEEYIPNVRLHNKLDDNIELIETKIQQAKIKKDKATVAKQEEVKQEEAKQEEAKQEEAKQEPVAVEEEDSPEPQKKSSEEFKIGWWDWE